jgi:hypothetical protein
MKQETAFLIMVVGFWVLSFLAATIENFLKKQ